MITNVEVKMPLRVFKTLVKVLDWALGEYVPQSWNAGEDLDFVLFTWKKTLEDLEAEK